MLTFNNVKNAIENDNINLYVSCRSDLILKKYDLSELVNMAIFHRSTKILEHMFKNEIKLNDMFKNDDIDTLVNIFKCDLTKHYTSKMFILSKSRIVGNEIININVNLRNILINPIKYEQLVINYVVAYGYFIHCEIEGISKHNIIEIVMDVLREKQIQCDLNCGVAKKILGYDNMNIFEKSKYNAKVNGNVYHEYNDVLNTMTVSFFTNDVILYDLCKKYDVVNQLNLCELAKIAIDNGSINVLMNLLSDNDTVVDDMFKMDMINELLYIIKNVELKRFASKMFRYEDSKINDNFVTVLTQPFKYEILVNEYMKAFYYIVYNMNRWDIISYVMNIKRILNDKVLTCNFNISIIQKIFKHNVLSVDEIRQYDLINRKNVCDNEDDDDEYIYSDDDHEYSDQEDNYF